MNDQEQFCPALAAGATLVTVNQRLARHYQRRYEAWQTQRNATVWDTPDVVSWTAWLTRLHNEALCEGLTEYPLLSASMDEHLWRMAVRKVGEKNTACEALLDEPGAARQAQAAWLIQHAWHCHVGEGALLSRDQLQFGEWSTVFRRLCHQHKGVDQSRIATELRQLWDDLLLIKALPAQLLFAGFLTPTTEQTLWWEGLPALGVDVSELMPTGEPVKPQRYQFTDDKQEWRVCASHARALLEKNPDLTIGVIIPELQSCRTHVLRAFDGVFFPALNPDEKHRAARPYDVSLGVSLAQQPVIHSALLTLRFLLEPVASAELTSVLLSPYLVKAKSASQQRQRCDRFFRDQRCWELSARALVDNETWVTQLDTGLKEALEKSLDSLKSDARTCRQWSEVFGHVLQRHLGWPSDNINSVEYQAVTVWQQVIEDFESLDDIETLGAIEALAELDRLCRQRLFQPETPRAAIQIMGRLESHGLMFDHLWITGCDATQWPPRPTATTLLPLGLQQERGVPESSAAHRLNAARREWAHWCSLAPNVIASSVATRDGQLLSLAACVATLPEHDVEQLPGYGQYPDAVDVIATHSDDLVTVADTHGPAVTDGAQVRGGARRLENQAKCPFKGFAMHHLNIKPLEHPDMGLDPRKHGTLLHLAMECFWKETKTSNALHALSDDALNDAAARAVDAAIAQEVLDEQMASMERPRVLRLVSDWLTLEKTREVAFTVESLEEEHPIKDYGFEIQVTVDRVDRLESGECLILDYKTGKNDRPADWALERVENPQLPLYSTVNSDLDALCYAQVVQNDMKFKGVARKKGLLPGVSDSLRSVKHPEDWDSWRAHWQESLQALATEIREGVATITPREKACDRCELKPLCRYRVVSDDPEGVTPDDGPDATRERSHDD